jgi:hypothetical protein
MAGVGLRTIQELGGWKTLDLVQRYSHLTPDHTRDTVEKIAQQFHNAFHNSGSTAHPDESSKNNHKTLILKAK